MSPRAPWLSLTHSLWALSMETRGLSEPPAHKANEWLLAARQTIPRLWGGEIRQGHCPSQSQWLRIHEHTPPTLLGYLQERLLGNVTPRKGGSEMGAPGVGALPRMGKVIT